MPAVPLPAQPGPLVPKLSAWKYFADAQYPVLDWNQPLYDDGAWLSGPGILGFGEAYISTPVPFGPDPNNKYITTLFRHTFELTVDPAEIKRLTLTANYDDGFAVYLNGVEVARRSLPGGTLQHSTLAAAHEGGIYEPVNISSHIGSLVQGTNFLAVEVHQADAASSDLVWDAELSYSTSPVEWVWSGAVTPQSAVVKAKLVQESVAVRLAVSETADFFAPVYSNWDTALTTENNRVVAFQIGGLAPRRRYYYAVEAGGILDTEKVGRLQTFPPDTGSFTFGFGSCALTATNHPVFETIRAKDPLFFFHLGDFHYENIAVNDRNLFRQAFDTVLSAPNQARLYREVPIVYIWDDHDYGPNNSDSTAPGRLAARQTYQEYVPHYPLAAGSGDVPIYFTFDVGRVHFVVCDSRSARSPELAFDDASKTMLGAAQKAWFKQELLDARTRYALIVWVNTLPWIGVTGGDAWWAYTNERRELADFITANDITNLCMISGDAHMLAIDDGRNNNYASGGGPGFPVMHAAALDQAGSLKGGPYSQGAFPGGGQFGLMTVTDTGDSVRVAWSGRNHLDRELVGYTFAVAANVPTGVEDREPRLPNRISLFQNYPNPFNSSTRISYDLPKGAHVLFDVYDILGRKVRTLVDERQTAGRKQAGWDGKDAGGKEVASGVYIYRIRAGEFAQSRKMILLR